MSDTAFVGVWLCVFFGRGHIGGMLGGAVLTYLLGPNLVRIENKRKKTVKLIDKPPLPLLAHRPSTKP